MTITPEERAFMRANCERKLPYDMAKFGRPDPDDMRILRLITDLDSAEAENAALRDRVEALEWFVGCYDVESQNISQTYEAYIEMLASLDAAREAIR